MEGIITHVGFHTLHIKFLKLEKYPGPSKPETITKNLMRFKISEDDTFFTIQAVVEIFNPQNVSANVEPGYEILFNDGGEKEEYPGFAYIDPIAIGPIDSSEEEWVQNQIKKFT